jgi:hypothetical protein
MSESEYQIVRDQRKEILIPMFEFINGSECFYMVGGPSMGKTRLLDFLMREDVQKNYLKDEGHDTWLVRVDMNRLAVQNEAGAVYELLLNSLIVELNGHENVASHREDFLRMDFKVLKKKELPLALRNFELAVNILCQGNNIKLCFLLDEFDRIYRHLSPETFSQLRAIRDSNKYSVIYGIFLRELPERLRPSPDPDNEDFYELISRNKLGLGPYSKIDTVEIIKKLEKRRGFDMMTSFQRDRLYEASGGHIGLVQVILSIIQEDPQLPQRLGSQGWLDWLSQHPMSVDESRKIWKGLSKDEQDGLSAFLKGNYHAIPEPVSTLLLAKGLIRKTSNGPCLFSPIFDHYARSLG